MYKGIFTDSDLLYRIDVVNSIDFYAMGFDMMRGETYARNALQWPQQERTDVLIVNVRLEDMSGFELAERIRRQMPQVKVIFLADSPDGADAQAAVRFGAFDYVLKSDGIDALRAALSRAAEELCAERRENAYLRSQTNWDEIIPKLLRLLTALRPEICEEHWQLYSRIKPLVSNDSFCIETLLVRALMEELRMEIRRRDKALFLQIRSSIMDTPLEELTSTHAVAKQIDTIWKLLSEKGYIMQEDALKSDTIGRACVYMQTHLGEKLTAESVSELRGQCLIPAANFCAQFLHQRAHQQSLHAQRSIAQQRLDFGIHLPVILVDARLQCQKQLQKSRNALIPVLLAAQICFFPTFRVQFL